MKRATIRMITFHSPKNYGAVLQAFSLMSYLKGCGHDVKVIDFITPHLRSIYPLVSKPQSMRDAVKLLLCIPFLPSKKSKYDKFDCFIHEKFDLTKRYNSYESLKDDCPTADYYVTGSDQVFNPNRIEEEMKAFYLDFGTDTTKRISYAGSFGTKEIPDEKKEEISRFLNRFNSVSVREASGVEIVQKLTGMLAQEVLDPVFLNNLEFWRKQEIPYPIGDEEYLLYYRLMSSPESDMAARKTAKNKNLKLVVITDNMLKWHADKVLRDVGPREFLYLFDKASYIATDSFHGVAFSLIYEKQFIFTDFNQKLSERALNLMEKVGASKCAAINGNEGSTNIEYGEIHERMKHLIVSSEDFIQKALS